MHSSLAHSVTTLVFVKNLMHCLDRYLNHSRVHYFLSEQPIELSFHLWLVLWPYGFGLADGNSVLVRASGVFIMFGPEHAS